MGGTALIAGGTGIIGRRLGQYLEEQGGWKVQGLSRQPDAASPFPLLSVDLTDASACRARLAHLSDVTHVFYTARYDHPEGVSESTDVNAVMLQNLIDAVEPATTGLRHIHAVHGTKYYGHQLGPIAIPAREDGPRARVPNFYHVQEDFLRERQRGKTWTFSTTRPHAFCEASFDEPRSIPLLIAVYAAVVRELKGELDYPGTAASYGVQTQFTHVPLLTRAIASIAAAETTTNEAYNVVNGDAPRWRELWPQFAECFGVRTGRLGRFRLADYMVDKDPVWQRIVARHNLRPTRLHELVLWPYADYVFMPEWDIISDVSKARRAGLASPVNSSAMFLEIFRYLRAEKIIP